MSPPSVLLYRSGRDLLLRVMEIVTLLPVAITVWLLSLMSPEQALADLGSPAGAWAFRIGLTLGSGILFYAFFFLHGRYVLSVELQGDDVRIRFWTVLGSRLRTWPVPAWGGRSLYHKGEFILPGRPVVQAPWIDITTPEGKKLMIDDQGDYPQGVEALLAVLTPGEGND